jgi:hypothetical protein
MAVGLSENSRYFLFRTENDDLKYVIILPVYLWFKFGILFMSLNVIFQVLFAAQSLSTDWTNARAVK